MCHLMILDLYITGEVNLDYFNHYTLTADLALKIDRVIHHYYYILPAGLATEPSLHSHVGALM